MHHTLRKKAWVFDMDGTLTLAAHDFDAFKKEQGMDEARPILEQLAEMPPQEAQVLGQRLWNWEADIADRAKPAPDAIPLLNELHSRNIRMGILTRNSKALAFRTLKAAGLIHFFDERDILGRECATPKPDPAGLLQILSRWQIPGSEAVMVGDYLFDLTAGRAADMFTIYIDRNDSGLWQDEADLRLTRLDQLLDRPE